MLIRFLLIIALFLCHSSSYADYMPDWERFHEVNDKTDGVTTYYYDRTSLKKVSLTDVTSVVLGVFALMGSDLKEDARPRYFQVLVKERFSEPLKVDNFIASSELRFIFFDCDNLGFVLDRQVYFQSSYLDGQSYTSQTTEEPFYRYWVKDIKSSDKYNQFVKILFQKFGKMCR